MATERTPLLPSSVTHPAPETRAVTASGAFHTTLDDSASNNSSGSDTPKKRKRWALWIVLVLLTILGLLLLITAFFVPAVGERYAKAAVVLNVSSIAVESFTPQGIEARVKANVSVDSSRVENKLVRRFGQLGTALARKVTTERGKIYLFLPDYDQALLANASVPKMILDVRDGHTNSLDFVSHVDPVSLESAKKLVDDYITGELQSLQVMGKARLDMHSGIVHFGQQLLTETITIEGNTLPSIPKYNITHLSFYENSGTIAVNISASIPNPYPIKANVPSLQFTVSLPDCDKKLVQLASAKTPELSILPKTEIKMNVTGSVETLPDSLTSACPGTDRSPLDVFLELYLHENVSTVYVSGSREAAGSGAPRWLVGFLGNITVPASVPGHKSKAMVESMGLSRVKFQLPEPGAQPGSPESSPRFSAMVDAVVGLPPELKFTLDVKNIKAVANLSYHGTKFGEVFMRDWMPARSSMTEEGKLNVEVDVEQAPMSITNYQVFRTVVQRLFWGGGRGLMLGVDGITDVRMVLPIKESEKGGVKAAGEVMIKGFPTDHPALLTALHNLDIPFTTESSITVTLRFSAYNPTNYTITVPYLSVKVLKDGYVLGNATVSETTLVPGANSLDVVGMYEPIGGPEAVEKGLEMLGAYLSGRETVLEGRIHADSVPGMEELGRALEGMGVRVTVPGLHGRQEGGRFVEEGEVHLLTSTAEMKVRNPLWEREVVVWDVDGVGKIPTDNGNGDELGKDVLGRIRYEKCWVVRKGKDGGEWSPRVPVEWGPRGGRWGWLGGWLGGSVRVRGEAWVGVGVGKWRGKLRWEPVEGTGEVEVAVRL
ncbi:hypothetical protein BDZ91DRAFT_650294 [Kalaharituber pfeilii]|nr:hypothetical protein BDZ91DRAFT_650294 [Kalaharituber pfeilii]